MPDTPQHAIEQLQSLARRIAQGSMTQAEALTVLRGIFPNAAPEEVQQLLEAEINVFLQEGGPTGGVQDTGQLPSPSALPPPPLPPPPAPPVLPPADSTRGTGGFVPPPPPPQVGTGFPLTAGLPQGTAGDQFLEQEGDPLQVFQQFLSGQPLGQLSGLGQRALQRQFQPALQSFRAQATSPEATFRDFLSGGGNILDPDQLRNRLTSIADIFSIPTAQRTDAQAFLTDQDRFGGNRNAFNAFLQPLLSRTNPLFRDAAARVAGNVFNRFQATTPEQAFLPFLAQRGGFFS